MTDAEQSAEQQRDAATPSLASSNLSSKDLGMLKSRARDFLNAAYHKTEIGEQLAADLFWWISTVREIYQEGISLPSDFDQRVAVVRMRILRSWDRYRPSEQQLISRADEFYAPYWRLHQAIYEDTNANTTN